MTRLKGKNSFSVVSAVLLNTIGFGGNNITV